tara:strand:+ start:502 stop:813 length:312 start_codon:yes stop_codon:yes gene_type:complete
MTKKNLDGQKTCDGQSQGPKRLTIYGNHINPQMRMKTLHEIARNTRMDMQNLHGLSLVAVTLTDSVLLLEALAIKYGDTPIVEVVNMLLDEAFENYEEKNGKQ